MSTLYFKFHIQSLEKELADDDAALDWFNLRTSASEIPLTPLAIRKITFVSRVSWDVLGCPRTHQGTQDKYLS